MEYCLGASPDSAVVKNPPTSAGDVGDMRSTPESGRSPGGGNDKSLQYSCLENLHGWSSLVGYSPWGPKELDLTEGTELVWGFLEGLP